MLALSRKTGEEIVIVVYGNKIRIQVVEIQSGKVRLGFEAAKHIQIDRLEVFRNRGSCEDTVLKLLQRFVGALSPFKQTLPSDVQQIVSDTVKFLEESC